MENKHLVFLLCRKLNISNTFSQISFMEDIFQLLKMILSNQQSRQGVIGGSAVVPVAR